MTNFEEIQKTSDFKVMKLKFVVIFIDGNHNER